MGPPRTGFLQGHGASLRTGRPDCVSLLPATARVAVGRRRMSYRELSMIDVHEVLRRWAAGQSSRKIARETGTDRKTVGRYIAVASELGLGRESEWTEAQVHEVAQRVQGRPLPDPT